MTSPAGRELNIRRGGVNWLRFKRLLIMRYLLQSPIFLVAAGACFVGAAWADPQPETEVFKVI